MQCRKCKLRRSRNKDGHGDVGVLIIEDLYDKVVEIIRINDRVMSLAIVFEEVLRVICAYAP